MGKKKNTPPKQTAGNGKAIKSEQNKFPERFPFWARLKISKNRTTLVIDEAVVINKKTKKEEPGFVHREATHSPKKKEYEAIIPNPDPDDSDPMYLKRPRKLPKRLFSPHNKRLNMPKELRERYERNNEKAENAAKSPKKKQ